MVCCGGPSGDQVLYGLAAIQSTVNSAVACWRYAIAGRAKGKARHVCLCFTTVLSTV